MEGSPSLLAGQIQIEVGAGPDVHDHRFIRQSEVVSTAFSAEADSEGDSEGLPVREFEKIHGSSYLSLNVFEYAE